MTKVCFYCSRFEGEQFNVRPLGVSYIVSYLIQNGLVQEDNIKIVDSLEEAIEFDPDILGVSSVSQVISNAMRVARKCKEATGCIAILGGYHISSVPEKLPAEFDIGVIGEGELTFAEVVKAFSRNVLSESVLRTIPGICFRNPEGAVLQTPLRELVRDISALPWPYRHKSYSSDEPIFTSRGCPYKCTYCAAQSFWRETTRFRSADSVIEEILYIVDNCQPKEIVILDDLWMADKKRFREIVRRLVAHGIPQKVSFRGFCRSNIVDEEMISLFKQINYRFVRFGAETGSERLLKRIKGSGISIKDHQRVVDLCARHNLKCGASFLFGLPGETIEDIDHTLSFLRRNKGRFQIIGFYLFNPIPGTVLWDELEKKGQVSKDLDFSRFQLDLLNSRFSWENALYFNEENIPLDKFQQIVADIRGEFFSAPDGQHEPQKSLLEKCFRSAGKWLRNQRDSIKWE